MSRVINWQYDDLFRSRKEKLINMLISEIIFLKNKSRSTNHQEFIEMALIKLEYLLNIINRNNIDLSEKDFNKVVLLIYNIFRSITEKLEKK